MPQNRLAIRLISEEREVRFQEKEKSFAAHIKVLIKLFESTMIFLYFWYEICKKVARLFIQILYREQVICYNAIGNNLKWCD